MSAAAVDEPVAPAYSLRQLLGYFLKLGTFGFGGPVALVSYMHRDLVERRQWISEADYKDGLALSQLAPGPLAAQLAIYLGYVHYRILGATLTAVAFVLPSFLMVVALGWAYKAYGGLTWMQAAFYGIGPAVIAIIAVSAYKLTRKTIGGDRLLWLAFLVSAVCTIVYQTEFVSLLLAAGVVVWILKTRVRRKPPQGTLLLAAVPLALTGPGWEQLEKLERIFLFFMQAGAFVFGSGLAIVPFLQSGVVHEHAWMNDDQFRDAVAVAMITPGPVVIVSGFIGYFVAGAAGAVVAAFATFLPCYLFTVIPAPYFKKYGRRPGIAAFVNGVTAAATGAIAGAVVVLGRQTIFPDGKSADLSKVAILAVTLAVLLSTKRIPEPLLVIAAGLIGLFIYR